MNLQRKLQIVEQSIRSISQHFDQDAAVRHAALDAIGRVLTAEHAEIEREVAAQVATALGPDAEG